MELINIEICVPKEMKTFLLNENTSDELKSKKI